MGRSGEVLPTSEEALLGVKSGRVPPHSSV